MQTIETNELYLFACMVAACLNSESTSFPDFQNPNLLVHRASFTFPNLFHLFSQYLFPVSNRSKPVPAFHAFPNYPPTFYSLFFVPCFRTVPSIHVAFSSACKLFHQARIRSSFGSKHPECVWDLPQARIRSSFGSKRPESV